MLDWFLWHLFMNSRQAYSSFVVGEYYIWIVLYKAGLRPWMIFLKVDYGKMMLTLMWCIWHVTSIWFMSEYFFCVWERVCVCVCVCVCVEIVISSNWGYKYDTPHLDQGCTRKPWCSPTCKYTERQKKFITSSEWRSLKSTPSKLMARILDGWLSSINWLFKSVATQAK